MTIKEAVEIIDSVIMLLDDERLDNNIAELEDLKQAIIEGDFGTVSDPEGSPY